ncbi:MAG: biotin--[acetyl-CoA-carboxylase] ligase [Bradymonadia bacterium]|jgi:biotin-[acetyl-CoA-carboxylase] ligase BirA-like protein
MYIWSDDGDFVFDCFPDACICKNSVPLALWEQVQGFCKADSGTFYESTAPSFSAWELAILEGNARVSQYDRLLAMPLKKETHNVLCVAKTGNGFHGQGHSEWLSPLGNLYFSASMRCDITSEEARNAVVFAAVSVFSALKRLEPDLPLSIKWVNDILLGDRKLSGVLASVSVASGRIVRLSVGIGVNIARAPRLIKPYFVQACALNMHSSLGLEQVLASLSAQLIERLGQWEHSGFGAMHELYLKHSYILEKNVKLHPYSSQEPRSAPIAKGVVEAILPDLSLKLRGYDLAFSDVKIEI